MVAAGNLFAERLAANNAFINSLTTQLLRADSAFIRDLVAKRIRTTGGEVDISDAVQRFGALEVNKEDGTVDVKDDNGFNTLSISNKSLPTTIAPNAIIGNTGYASLVPMTVSGTYSLGNTVELTAESTLLVVQCDLAKSAGIQSSITARLIRIVGDVESVYAVLGSVSGVAAASRNIRVEQYVGAGVYRLDFGANVGGSNSWCRASAIMMNYYYNPDNRWSFCDNGYGWMCTPTSYDVTRVTPTTDPDNPLKLTKSFHGDLDYPGVLAKARVGSDNFISRKWGKNIIRVESATTAGANKKVIIEKINEPYSVICTPYGGGSMPVVYNEQPTYFEVYATGGFNVMLVGDNK